MNGDFEIGPAHTSHDLAAVCQLFRDYAASLDVDLQYQNFSAELASIPGPYGPPEGELLLARSLGGAALGCVAMRSLGHGRCEVKRLYVSPVGRGLGLGRALVRRMVEAAERKGYSEIVLDTLSSMAPAQALYRSEGFAQIEPYYDTPIAGTLFMGLSLKPGGLL